MNLEFTHQALLGADRIERQSDTHRSIETWTIEGSAGDRVMVDVHLPAEVNRIVVMGHGAENSRKARYIELSAKRLTRHGAAVIALDAPFHGDRAGEGELDGVLGAMVDLMVRWVRDHRRLLDVIEDRWPGIPVGFAGFSMGGLYGVPLVASDQRIRSTAIVIAGSTRVSYPQRFGKLDKTTRERLAVADPAVHAPRVGNRPVLLLNADADEIVSRDAALALYDAFTGPKELVFMPGTHAEWGHAARWFRRLEQFFAETLR